MSNKLRNLPTDPAALKTVKGNINEMVDAMLQVESFKEHIKTIKEVAGEKFDLDGSYMQELANVRYDSLYNENKKNLKAEEKAEIVDTVKCLFD